MKIKLRVASDPEGIPARRARVLDIASGLPALERPPLVEPSD
jgi:hypothetical protein